MDLTWHTTDRLDFGTGLRYSYDNSTIAISENNILSISDTLKNHLSGQLSAGYQLTDRNRIYMRIAQDYQSGGFDYAPTATLSAYQPQQSITYELGHRYNSDNLHLQGAMFYSTIKDVQMHRGEPGQQTLQNAGYARTYGLELSGDYIFLAGWKLAANMNFTNSRFTDDEKNNSPSSNFSGKRIPFVPDYSGAIYITGHISTAIGSLNPYVGLNVTGCYTYKDESNVKQLPYTTTDIRLVWQVTDRITMSAYVNNIFDRRFSAYAYTAYINNVPVTVASVNNGRTTGVDVKIDLF